jgi:hypothetical protein
MVTEEVKMGVRTVGFSLSHQHVINANTEIFYVLFHTRSNSLRCVLYLKRQISIWFSHIWAVQSTFVATFTTVNSELYILMRDVHLNVTSSSNKICVDLMVAFNNQILSVTLIRHFCPTNNWHFYSPHFFIWHCTYLKVLF